MAPAQSFQRTRQFFRRERTADPRGDREAEADRQSRGQQGTHGARKLDFHFMGLLHSSRSHPEFDALYQRIREAICVEFYMGKSDFSAASKISTRITPKEPENPEKILENII
jgi:hypothetical protein